jgi:cytochrome c oxidase cbb3-type subunit 3/ubiquinol-cytochrome c reductase cytochrome c subunit
VRISSLLPLAAVSLLSLSIFGCDGAPGRPQAGPEVPRPEQVQDFATLYKQNCAACHGENGRQGAAVALANPEYLALAGEETLVQVTVKGVPGTLMPAFAESAGGMLTDRQIRSLVDGMMKQWGKPGVLAGQNPPSYAAAGAGDPQQGQQVFATFCARCHGADGRGLTAKDAGAKTGRSFGSIVDPSYLALVSDQSLRTTTIVGIPGEGMPDWRGDAPSRAMTDKEVTDVVAWLASKRTPYPGQPYPTSPQAQQHPQ